MFRSKKSPQDMRKHSSVVPAHSAAPSLNPFDSDHDFNDKKRTINTSGKTSSETKRELSSNPFDDDNEVKGSSSQHAKPMNFSSRNKYKNDFLDSGGLENQSVQELENYAVYKAEETTKSVNSCLKIAEGIREDATKTMVMLHHQGEQITRAHAVAADIDHDLSRGEKLLGSLGGIFSKTWKPKKTHSITGPMTIRDDVQRKGNHLEQREKLGLTSTSKSRPDPKMASSEPNSSLQKVEVEKAKQDDALSDLSNVLGELKNMALDMGSELNKHKEAMDPFLEDVEELNIRVKHSNQRARYLLRK